MSFASQYQDWTEEQKRIAREGALLMKTQGFTILEQALGISIENQIYDVLLAGSFGSKPGYGSPASDLDILVIVEKEIEMPQLKQVLRFAQNQANVNLIGQGFENSSNLQFMIWQSIQDRSHFGGQPTDVTATSLIDGMEFVNSIDFYTKRLAD